MNGVFKGTRVAAIASTVPATSESLSELEKFWPRAELERIIGSTGITRVRVAPAHLSASDLCLDAAERLLRHVDVPPSRLDAIVFVSQTPDYVLPPTSAVLHGKLGAPHDALAFDINYGCSGFIYGLLQANLLIRSEVAERVLVCAGEVTTRLISPKDRAVRMVFGDAGSAALVEKGEDTSAFAIKTDGSKREALIVPAGGFRKRVPDSDEADEQGRHAGHFHMDGMNVMSFAMREVPPIVDKALELRGWKKDEVDLFALHQANEMIVNNMRKRMQLDERTAPFLLGEYGNSGPASIPTMLCLRGNAAREKVLLCGFGTGLSWGAAALPLANTALLEVHELT